MDDITYCYLYNSWMQKQEDELKKLKMFGCFVGSFWNGEMARKIQNEDDGNKNRKLDDDEFQKTLDYIEKENEEYDKRKNIETRKNKKKKLYIKQ